MIRIALQSAALHRRSFLATGVVIAIGTMLVAAMAGVLATGLAGHTPRADKPFLTQFPLIMGSWILAIAVFAVVSTVAVALDARGDEVRSLRLIGATPGQVRRMIAIETAAVATIAAVPGIGLGYAFSWLIIDRVRAIGLIGTGTGFDPGIVAPLLGALLIVIASIGGGYLGAKAVAERSPVDAPGASARSRRGPIARRVTAALVIVAGLVSSSTSLTMDPSSVYATAATGPGVVFVTVGLALIATEILGLANVVLRALPLRESPSLHLARINLRAAPDRIRPVVTFLILFIGVAAGTLSMQGIENTANAENSGGEGIGAVMASINYLVVMLIAAFIAVALANNLISAIHGRHEELATMSLVGATRQQVQRTLTTETLVAAAASALAATLGAVVTVTPFAIAKLGTPLASLSPLPSIATIAAGFTLAVGITLIATRKQLRR